MQREDIRRELDRMIRELRSESNLPSGGITESHLLVDDIGLDSINTMEFMSMLTEHYEVDIDLEDVQHILSVGDVIDFIVPRISAA